MNYSDLSTTDKERIDALIHFGVLGMHWGHRKARSESSSSGQSRSKPSQAQLRSIYNKSADIMNERELPRINNHPKYKGKDLYKTGLLKEYDAEIKTAYEKALNEAEAIVMSESESKHSAISHADIEGLPTPKFIRNNLGFVIKIAPSEETLTQTGMSVDEYLSHFGVLGMHWGHRRERRVLLRKEHKKFQEDLKNLHESGKGNDTKEVINLAKKYDARAKAIGRGKLSQKDLNEARDFIKSRRALSRRRQRATTDLKIGMALAAAYAGTKLIQIYGPDMIRRAAWATGKVVSNSPL